MNYVVHGGFKRVFVITGTRSFAHFDGVAFLKQLSKQAAIEIVIGIPQIQTYENLLALQKKAISFAPDLVLGIGGGSVLDSAKLISVVCGAPISEPNKWLGPAFQQLRRETGLVLVPTTAGSGSEATHFSVLYFGDVKHSISSAQLLPDRVVLDSALVESGSALQLAASGLDALCQSIESLWARKATPESRHFAKSALKTLAPEIVGFVNGDLSRAGQMQWGSHLAGHAINLSTTTAPHALSYFLTAELGIPHGIAVASTLGYFLDCLDREQGKTEFHSRDLEVAIGTVKRVLGIANGRRGVEFFEELFEQLGLRAPESYWPLEEKTLSLWMDSVNYERLTNFPLEISRSDLPEILGLNQN